MFCWYLRYTN